VITAGTLIVGGLPGGASTQKIERAVEKAEAGYFVAGGSGAPTVSYVVTTPNEAFDYLNTISWSNAFYSYSDCRCAVTQNMATGEFGTTSVELSLIPAESGAVGLVELSGDRIYWDSESFMVSGGPICIRYCHRTHPPIYEARVAFLVVNLTDGMTTGGMIATPQNRVSSFDLSSLGTVSSWTGPDFGAPLNGQVKALLVDKPHLSGH